MGVEGPWSVQTGSVDVSGAREHDALADQFSFGTGFCRGRVTPVLHGEFDLACILRLFQFDDSLPPLSGRQQRSGGCVTANDFTSAYGFVRWATCVRPRCGGCDLLAHVFSRALM
jgi:hypothetical protein